MNTTLLTAIKGSYAKTFATKKAPKKPQFRQVIIEEVLSADGPWSIERRIQDYESVASLKSYQAISRDCINEYVAYHESAQTKNDYENFKKGKISKKLRTGAELKRVFKDFLFEKRFDPRRKSTFNWQDQLNNTLEKEVPKISATVMRYAWEHTDKSEFSLFTHHFNINETEKWEQTGQSLNNSLGFVLSNYAKLQGVFHNNYKDWHALVLSEEAYSVLGIKAPPYVKTLDAWLNYKITRQFADNSDGLSEAQKLYFAGLDVRGSFFRGLARKSTKDVDEPAAYVIGCKATFFVDVKRKVSGGRVTAPQKVKIGGYFYEQVYLLLMRDKRQIDEIVQRFLNDPELEKYWKSIPSIYTLQLTQPSQDKEGFIRSVHLHIKKLTLKQAADSSAEEDKSDEPRKVDDLELYQKVLDVYESAKLDDYLDLVFWEYFNYLDKTINLSLLSDLANETSLSVMCKHYGLTRKKLIDQINQLTEKLRCSEQQLKRLFYNA